jgi:hypothetical protein
MADRDLILDAIGERLGRVHVVDLEIPELLLKLLEELAAAEAQQEAQAPPAGATDDDNEAPKASYP